MASKKSQKAALEWQPLPPDAYRKTIKGLVHLSAKISNSKTRAGVRLAKSSALPLPYVSVRTLLAHTEELDLDYAVLHTSKSQAFKQINAARIDSAVRANADKAEINEIDEGWNEAAQQHFETGTAFISMRLSQLLLPVGNGEYRAFTPLASASLAKLIDQHIDAHHTRCKEQPKGGELRWIPRAVIGIGGTKWQNAGSLVRHFKPLVCAAPVENRNIKHALHLFYHGGSITLRHTLMREWRASLVRVQTTGSNSAVARATERDVIRRIVFDVLAANRTKAQTLHRHRAYLPTKDDSLLAASVALVPRGLVLPEERSAEWREQFGARLAQAMASYSYLDTQRTASLDPAAIHWLATTIEGAL
ncbi:hypothetical protein [Amantichitinum ursilacus]|uniref:Uncharacterized protein n=1 Tax=Amantichitinum ursilacus TaxID=857265 RepID=A0A0N0GNZ4_9NEIS|nr:hypothetical protein [Amantichitinum ursilacus]KPC53216.1 hypothetical protein WG78_09000 [Amantichitinum ursilacus]